MTLLDGLKRVLIRVCLYARFSTDLQNDKSNQDQLRELQEHLPTLARLLGVDPADLVVVLVEQDAAKSGATVFQRAGLRRVRRAASESKFDIVLTEMPNRLARKLGEMGMLYDELKYYSVRWFTIIAGEMDPMKIAMWGAASQQNLEENKYFVRRGLRGCIEDGRAAGGLSFGYSLDTSQKRFHPKRRQMEVVKGVLVIDPAQAAVVVRIFKLYVAGLSSKAIAKLLNGEGIRGPRGRMWRPSTIHGNQNTGVGILNNELYRGRLVHGRREYRMNPATGLRGKAILNPPSALKVKDVPHLRIVDEELWERVKQRQAATKRAQRAGLDRARRPKFLFSKLTKCSVCGGGFTTESRDELRCHNYREAGPSICTNGRVIKRTEVERRVSVALQKRFLTPGRLKEYTRRYVAESNRLRSKHRAALAAAPRELEANKRRAMEILNFMLQGFVNEDWKAELRRLDEQRAELETTIATAAAQAMPPVLHPDMARVFEEKVMNLAKALEHDDPEQRESARSILRGFIDQIVIPPGDELLQVVGRLGEMLSAAGADSTVVGNSGCGGAQAE